MFPSDFWYGFLIGAGLAFLAFFVTTLISRSRAKKSGDS
jgi:hypothetical protein